ncbi:hypothetical protein ACK4CS_16780 [Enterococcus gallinarum]|uniref:Uncharacterized protein n=4 Tax=Enterococcus TaxID=1350 RepID=A0A376GXV1_ENTGA|nr:MULTISPECIES: hypothetical protein [Enterococcus]MDT2688222.1 hypothetical protein [Enterococcus gallinarum]MDT2691161.1 hypothetical protein [Enterococcus gallinarum]CAI3304395.1 hypothetical protein CIRMBP1246_00745 [Enterococcus cecorum]CAI3370446.1 hypothetical protein CIRMBP1231_01218 [Enterococcus cecorum]CAI3460011.1 hypothetical protein CIRMBP1269_01989 [Enterococcus cecorum]
MNFADIKSKLKPIFYNDMSILDVHSCFFMDEIYIYIEIDDNYCWKISFLSCYKVDYETDANWRGDYKVRDVKPSSGYYGQEIFVNINSENEDFVEFTIDLTIMTMKIICKSIEVEKINREDIKFFWETK